MYKILVSEVMLQQTQVERVIPFYIEFTRRYPTAKKLATAPLSDVLAAWSGLGYNRRAKLLREAAKELATVPLSGTRSNLVKRLEALPGVGPYTARAVAAFAYNADVVFVETNIRTAVIHHFFPKRGAERRVGRASKDRFSLANDTVSDKEIEAILTKALPKGRAREWYSALMDYGAHLKKSGVRINAQSAHYAKQATFAGSLRQVRGAILKALTVSSPLTEAALRRRLENHRGDASMIARALGALEKDGLITKKGRGWRIA